MENLCSAPLRVGIVGAGFSGTALAAMLHRLSHRPIDIILCDKSGDFGAGPAYSTPFSYHLLNVRAEDMSAFEDEPMHFVNWLNQRDDKQQYFDLTIPLSVQFAPRCLYRQYLLDILSDMPVTLVSSEVVDMTVTHNSAVLVCHNQQTIAVDVVVLALGHPPPRALPFAVAKEASCIANPWDYTALKQIASTDSVMIVGTGLSMIDAVLTLYHQQHQGPIYTISRHGLLPLPHGATKKSKYQLEQVALPTGLRQLVRQLRTWSRTHVDWREVVHAMRVQVARVWRQASLQDKKRFLRHVLPFWNVHRHRVHQPIRRLLADLLAQKKLMLLSGRVREVKHGVACVQLRHALTETQLPVNWLVNCMGPMTTMQPAQQPLLQALAQRQLMVLDELQLGFAVSPQGALQNMTGSVSNVLYSVGAPTKGAQWEISAVPEIRKQVFDLARHLLARA